MPSKTIWVVEFNCKQQAFHVEELTEHIEHNLESLVGVGNPHNSDWAIIGCADSHHKASLMFDALKPIVRGDNLETQSGGYSRDN